MLTAPMKIEIWSDVVCPWCFVGKRHLEQALKDFPHAGEIELEWRSYELDPTAPRERPGTYFERIAKKYGLSIGEARARVARIVQVGSEAGIDFRFDDARPGNTFDAHRLLHFARTVGRQDELKERFFVAAFTEGHPIGDRDTLVKLAADVGLAEDDVRRVLDSDEYADAVRADEAEAMQLEVHGVPHFVIDRRFAVPGAQAPETMRLVLERAWQMAHPIETVGGDGGMCEDGACEV